MPSPIIPQYVATDVEMLAGFEGRIAVLIGAEGRMDKTVRRLNRLARGALQRLAESAEFGKMKEGEARAVAFPAGVAADAIIAVKLSPRTSVAEARKAGASIAKLAEAKPVLLVAGNYRHRVDIGLGLTLRRYDFDLHKTGDKADTGPVTLMCEDPDASAEMAGEAAALAEGVFFTRDLVNEPSNVLTTTSFADRLLALKKLGLKVEVLEEDALEKLGMRCLLAVGQGSASPSKVVVIQWTGGGDEAPLALVGKGVVFDTGGISIKPAAGMEDMTMDMGGAGVVAGVMKALALAKTKANVVGLVGLVENMPDGLATRPGDVVASMKGDTVEIINTDAEGRLVLCDVMWYAQDRFKPSGMIDLATLTGAIIIGLGHENAGVFSNNDALCQSFLKAARREGEGAWRMPLAPAYDKLLKSNVADMKNVGGRPAGSITAAQFLARFVKNETPWIHLDIAGVASVKSETALAPKGATGWGVLALHRLIEDMRED